MDKYRIKAYFMHEHEQDVAKRAEEKSLITEAEWTPGYVMGVCGKSAIKRLSDQGLVVSYVEKVGVEADAVRQALSTEAVAARPSVLRAMLPRGTTKPALGPARAVSAAPKKIMSHDAKQTQFYVVRFHGAITAERGRELRGLRIDLQDRLTRNEYVVELKPSQVKELANLSFVDFIRLYTKEDTLKTDAPPKPSPAKAQPARLTLGGSRSPARAANKVSIQNTIAANKQEAAPRYRVYSVTMHRPKDVGKIAKWLTSRKHKPFRRQKNGLQVMLQEGSKLLSDLAQRTEVAVVQPVEAPRLFDATARAILGLQRAKKLLGLEGEGEIIAVADTGIDDKHEDFKKRVIGIEALGRKNDSSDPDGHGTHVAGCAAGDGSASDGDVCGAAPKSKIYFQSILDANGDLGGLPDDLGDLFQTAYDKGARIHNNSWGAFNFARYGNTSLEVDEFVDQNPDMLIVIAAGNDGIGIPRVNGAKMTARNGFVDWPCVAAPATAKNSLTVGASRNARTTGGYSQLTWNDAWGDRYPAAPISDELISGDDQCLAAFSSRGPSDDLRIKPDLVAPGTDIAAAKSQDAPLSHFWGAYPGNSKYGFMGGTSMAAPYVAGCAALVREWYRKTGKWATPSAALLKATLINGTQRITGVDSVADLQGNPNFHQGFGRVDMAATVPNSFTPDLGLKFVDSWKDKKPSFVVTGDRVRFQIKVGTKLPLRVCLAWTDPPGRGLQNSLVLLVDDGGTPATKWIGNADVATVLNIAGGPRDPNNNVQKIRVEKPKAGNYTVSITAGMLLKKAQAFSLVVTGDLKSDLTPY